MPIRSRLLLVSCLVLCMASPAAFAQSSSESTTYVLRDFSTTQEGCFAPCMCPILALYLGGTFELTPAGTDGEFALFRIDDVNWIATVGGPVVQRITGSGTFRISDELQQLVLDLQFDDGPVERYDSGVVPVGTEFPEIDVLASIGDLFCYDEVVDIRARPLEPGYLHLDLSRFNLYWSHAPGSGAYDVVAGNLGSLRSSEGDFTAATEECLAIGRGVPVLDYTATVAPGEARWFVVRGLPAARYDSNGPAQVGVRDIEIDDAPASCP